MNLKKWFDRKIIIHSTTYKPATYIKSIRCRGEQFIRVAFPHLKKFHDRMPVTDIPFRDVTAFERLPSAFQKWAYGLIGKKARPKYYRINHKRNSNGKP